MVSRAYVKKLMGGLGKGMTASIGKQEGNFDFAQSKIFTKKLSF
jgi:hypothetical protein